MSSHPYDVLIVGAGPAGSAAALHALRAGLGTILLIDGQSFPRDKTCGDGLTPRALRELSRLNVPLGHPLHQLRGLSLHGFGSSVHAPWPDSMAAWGASALPRSELDTCLVREASKSGVDVWENTVPVGVEWASGRISAVTLRRTMHNVDIRDIRVRPRLVIVADGVRSTFGKELGRQWHRHHVFGIAARAYAPTPRTNDPWMHSHVELRDSHGVLHGGYGWIFPLGNGEANVGCGALSTLRRPAHVNTKKMLHTYADSVRDEWSFGKLRAVASALLPMGGAVSHVAGRNWILVGDAAACVNPLNGEGIDYALESARLGVEVLASEHDPRYAWPHALRHEYGAAFTLARTLALLLTHPRVIEVLGACAFHEPTGHLLRTCARLMSNLVVDSDHDLVARLWRAAGSITLRHALWTHQPLWD